MVKSTITYLPLAGTRDMEHLTGAELIFYKDQCSARECQLSEEVDSEYEDRKRKYAEEAEVLKLESFINPPEFQEVMNTSTPNNKNK